MARGARRPQQRRLSLNVDRLAHNCHVFPRTVDFHLVGVGGVDALEIEVLHIRPHVGDAPRDCVVVANREEGQRRERGAGHVQRVTLHLGQVPD